jgi:hypothetical protein
MFNQRIIPLNKNSGALDFEYTKTHPGARKKHHKYSGRAHSSGGNK